MRHCPMEEGESAWQVPVTHTCHSFIAIILVLTTKVFEKVTLKFSALNMLIHRRITIVVQGYELLGRQIEGARKRKEDENHDHDRTPQAPYFVRPLHERSV